MCVFTTWSGNVELHGVGPHAHICIKSTAIETTVFLCDTSEVQADFQAVGAVHSASVAVVLTHQASLHLLADTNNVPDVLTQLPLQNHLVDGYVVRLNTPDGRVVLLFYQLCDCQGLLWESSICDVEAWRFI